MFGSVGCAATVWIAPTTSLLGIMFSTCPFRVGPGPWAVHLPPTARGIIEDWRREDASRDAALLSSSKSASPAASDGKRIRSEVASSSLTIGPCTRPITLVAPESEQPGAVQL